MPQPTRPITGWIRRLSAGLLGAVLSAQAAETTGTTTSDRSRFSDQPRPLQIDTFPDRPAPLLELGDHFLGPGNIRNAYTLPTGAVWHPSFWVFGNFRSAIQTFDNGPVRQTEWMNNLDLFGNLQLAATERILVGFRPLHQDGRFTGYVFEPDGRDGGKEDFNENSLHPTTLFFEGEFGELFPKLDKSDRRPLDIGISVGRQPFTLQDGLLVNDDSLDLIALTQNSILPRGGSTFRASAIFAWGQIQRENNTDDDDSQLVGIDLAADFPKSTYNLDLLYVPSSLGDDGFYAGIGQTRRWGKINATVRAVTSVALDNESARVRSGTLLFSELSYTPSYGNDLVYLNGFWALDEFTSAVRGPFAGGPLGRVGLLFAAVGLGNYGAPLSNRAQNAAGGALGYQMFFGELRRRQLVFELGGRAPTANDSQSAAAAGIRFQQALGQRTVLIVDIFGGVQQRSAEIYGARLELLVKF